MSIGLYQEFYERELQRHEHLQSAVNTPISVVTLLAGGLVLMGKGFDSEHPVLVWLFWSLGATSAVLVGVCIYLLVRSIYGYRYMRMPFASELAIHHTALARYFRRKGKPGRSEEAFDEYLSKWYIAVADHNTVNNDRRGEYLYRANRFLVYALCATVFTAVPAGIAAKTAQNRPQDVRITHLGSNASEILERRNAEEFRPHAIGARRSNVAR